MFFCGAIILGVYHYLPYMLVSSPLSSSHLNPSGEKICFIILLYSTGLFLFVGAEIQQYLKFMEHKDDLVDDYLFSSNRNTNYLGLMMIYSSLAYLIGNKESWIILISIWITIFAGAIIHKESKIYGLKGYKEYFDKEGIRKDHIFCSSRFAILISGVSWFMEVFCFWPIFWLATMAFRT